MANKEHLRILRRGPAAWNKLRSGNLDLVPDLSSADLRGAHLSSADLTEADLSRARGLTKEQIRSAAVVSEEKGAVDDKSREVVLQALFSRSDTGLLHKDAGSPTMPGSIANILTQGMK